MTDADKLERIRSIVRDHDAYGLSRHHEMVLDITDVLAEESEAEGAAPSREHRAQKRSVQAFDIARSMAERGRLAVQLLEMALALPDSVLHAPLTHAEKLYPLCNQIQRYQRACREDACAHCGHRHAVDLACVKNKRRRKP